MIRQRPRRAMSQINVVPYIDVMLVLLIIFMVTAPFINPSQVELPSVGKVMREGWYFPIPFAIPFTGPITP